MTAGQSLSSLQVPASPEEVAQSPPAPVLSTLTWLLTRVAAEESSKMLDIIDIILTLSANSQHTLTD